MYAITGITGQVGGAVAATLLDRHIEVRAVARDIGRAEAWIARGCEVAPADFADIPALTKAFSQIDGVFVVLPPAFDPSPGFPEARAIIGNILAALRAAAPPKVVALSTIGAQANEPNLLSQLGLLEDGLRTLSMPVTIVRPAWFIENAAWDVADARSGHIYSYLQPLDKALPMVSVADVGRLAGGCLLETWEGLRTIEVEGAERVSPNDLAAALAEVLGHKVTAEAVARTEWEALFRAQGMRYPLPRMRMLDGFNAGWIDFPDGSATSRKGRIGLIEAVRRLCL